MSGMETNVTSNTAAFQRAFRDVLGHFPTGVVLVTGIAEDGKPVGMILGSFTSVSLDPPIVAFLPARESSTFKRLQTVSQFCVNVLAADQTEVCRAFSRKDVNDKFAGFAWRPSASGAPILDGVVASIDCTLDRVLEAGDHFIVLGNVDDLRVHNPTMPLLFFQGGYGRFTTHSLVTNSDAGLIEVARRAEQAREELEELAESLNVECTIMARRDDDVVVLASATGPKVKPVTRLGTHNPLMPPLGELFIADSPPVEVDAWLRRRSSIDSVTEENYRKRLQVTRERGWSLATIGQYREHEFAEAISRYRTGDLTPALRRDIANVIASVSAEHETVELLEGRNYDVKGIVAPIREQGEEVRMVLRISQLQPQAEAKDVRRWIDDLIKSAERISMKINSHANQQNMTGDGGR